MLEGQVQPSSQNINITINELQLIFVLGNPYLFVYVPEGNWVSDRNYKLSGVELTPVLKYNNKLDWFSNRKFIQFSVIMRWLD